MGLRFRIYGFGFKIIKGDPGIKASGSQGSHDMQVHFGPYMLGAPLRGRWRSGEEAHHKPERLNSPAPCSEKFHISPWRRDDEVRPETARHPEHTEYRIPLFFRHSRYHILMFFVVWKFEVVIVVGVRMF